MCFILEGLTYSGMAETRCRAGRLVGTLLDLNMARFGIEMTAVYFFLFLKLQFHSFSISTSFDFKVSILSIRQSFQFQLQSCSLKNTHNFSFIDFVQTSLSFHFHLQVNLYQAFNLIPPSVGCPPHPPRKILRLDGLILELKTNIQVVV